MTREEQWKQLKSDLRNHLDADYIEKGWTAVTDTFIASIYHAGYENGFDWCKQQNKIDALQKANQEFPTNLAMRITEIVLNKEPGWSNELEELLEDLAPTKTDKQEDLSVNK